MYCDCRRVSFKAKVYLLIAFISFFEWKKQTNGKKQAFYIKRKDGKLMAFAGLYDKSELTGKLLF